MAADSTDADRRKRDWLRFGSTCSLETRDSLRFRAGAEIQEDVSQGAVGQIMRMCRSGLGEWTESQGESQLCADVGDSEVSTHVPQVLFSIVRQDE